MLTKPNFTSLPEVFFLGFSWVIQGELHPYPKIGMFCTISQNYQHFLKMHLKQIVQGTRKNGIEILIGQVVPKLWIKTVKILFDQ